VRSGRTDQNTPFTQQVHDTRGLRCGRGARRSTAPQLDANEQASTAHFGDQCVPRPQLPQQLDQISACVLRVLHQSFGLDHVENCNPGSGRNRVTAEGVEVARSPAKLREQFWTGCHSGDGMAIAHRLAHRDQIGNEAVARKAPHPSAAAAEAGLHFIRNEQRTGRAYGIDSRSQKTGRIGEYAVAGEDRIDQKRRRPDAAFPHVFQRVADMMRKHFAGVRFRTGRRYQSHVTSFRKR
jgi:hypothetical protein